jgi:hypothetical protein
MGHNDLFGISPRRPYIESEAVFRATYPLVIVGGNAGEGRTQLKTGLPKFKGVQGVCPGFGRLRRSPPEVAHRRSSERNSEPGMGLKWRREPHNTSAPKKSFGGHISHGERGDGPRLLEPTDG